MQATVVDLRYKMNDVLKALDRNENIDVLYRGKIKGVLTAHVEESTMKVAEHPFFNMYCTDKSVDAEMDELRGGRYNDI
ncbi:MAG: type II toxin-antitoxin system Phd/YefM family antitoxin [Kiritimatiellae bacterium]|nr:type II toxin-antitoxin system Phd/YefM family antitoxin [Kiritimatiellia bacterium]